LLVTFPPNSGGLRGEDRWHVGEGSASPPWWLWLHCWRPYPSSASPGRRRWALFGEFVSARDHHTVDQDAKMFFALGNAVFDAGIAAWDGKRAFDSVRPITAIRWLFHGQPVHAWAGPGLGPG
jgi:hypothetical protein